MIEPLYIQQWQMLWKWHEIISVFEWMYLLHIYIEIIQQMFWGIYWDISEISMMVIIHKVFCDLQT